ncbi:hypothetical protein [Neptuniibacter sp. CAU 1671]|nr:hypothetical protein [Neptuniibacter sp. CAU 1671]MDF2181995.1 hypothetical protein [Neptuniibacter sp. CAU 1671]
MLLLSLTILAVVALILGVIYATPTRPEPVRIRVEEQPVPQRRRRR